MQKTKRDVVQRPEAVVQVLPIALRVQTAIIVNIVIAAVHVVFAAADHLLLRKSISLSTAANVRQSLKREPVVLVPQDQTDIAGNMEDNNWK